MYHTALVKLGSCSDIWWPDLWPDLVLSVTSNSNICTRQLTPYRWFSIKCALLEVIALPLLHPHPRAIITYVFVRVCVFSFSDRMRTAIFVALAVVAGHRSGIWTGITLDEWSQRRTVQTGVILVHKEGKNKRTMGPTTVRLWVKTNATKALLAIAKSDFSQASSYGSAAGLSV